MYFRLVNLLSMTTEDTLWKAVRQTRADFFLRYDGNSKQCETLENEHLLKQEFIEYNMNNLEDTIGMRPSWFPFKNIPDEMFQTAAKMFFSLNYCPPKESFLFTNIFANLSVKNIILALSNILKSDDEDVTKIATPLWIYFCKKFNLHQSLVESLHGGKYQPLELVNEYISQNESKISSFFEFTVKNIYFQGMIDLIQMVTNHPVHIVNNEGSLSPSSLIPFCSFSNNMSIMGTKIEQLEVPVCSSFRPKIVQDQLCYTLDPNQYKIYIKSGEELSISLLVDYNQERHFDKFNYMENESDTSELTSLGNAHEAEDFVIIESIGK